MGLFDQLVRGAPPSSYGHELRSAVRNSENATDSVRLRRRVQACTDFVLIGRTATTGRRKAPGAASGTIGLIGGTG